MDILCTNFVLIIEAEVPAEYVSTKVILLSSLLFASGEKHRQTFRYSGDQTFNNASVKREPTRNFNVSNTFSPLFTIALSFQVVVQVIGSICGDFCFVIKFFSRRRPCGGFAFAVEKTFQFFFSILKFFIMVLNGYRLIEFVPSSDFFRLDLIYWS